MNIYHLQAALCIGVPALLCGLIVHTLIRLRSLKERQEAKEKIRRQRILLIVWCVLLAAVLGTMWWLYHSYVQSLRY